MKELELSEQILEDIVVNDEDFSEALRKVFQPNQDLRQYRAMVAGLVGCTLRHILLLNYLIKPLETLSEAEGRFVSLCLANAYFYKRISLEDLKKELVAKLGEEKAALVEPLLAKGTENNPILPDDLPHSSNRYLALRYNTPEWVLKIWQHFGYGNCYKVLRHNARPSVPYVRLNAKNISEEEFEANYPDYKKTSVPFIYEYNGKSPLRKETLYQRNQLFPEKPATKFLIDTYRISLPEQAFIYTDNRDSSLLKELVASYGENLAMNVGVDNMDYYVDFKKMLKSGKEGGYRNVNFFAADSGEMLSAVKVGSQALVIACPDSTNFDRIRETPDYLLHFKREAMDAIIAKEKRILENCSQFVAEKGTLIYLVYTISLKEGRQTVNDFIANHPEFHVIKEEQRFPFDELGTAFYYCAMQKETIAEKLVDPVVAASALKENEVLYSSAQGKEAEG